MKATVKGKAPKPAWPVHSRLYLAHALKVGDRIGEKRIEERLRDIDGSLVYVLDDGSLFEVPPLPPPRSRYKV